MDTKPELNDVDVDAAGDIVPARIFASRGFAHPRMSGSQYAAGQSRRLPCARLASGLEEAIAKSVGWPLLVGPRAGVVPDGPYGGAEPRLL